VCFNQDWAGYDNTIAYRVSSAKTAAQYGALAVLGRSVTPFSLSTVHTGTSQAASIPAASITPEDAEYLHRIYKRSLTAASSKSPFKSSFVAPRVKLVMGATTQERTSRNVVINLKGSEKPEEIVLISGHLDSWDVGMGVIDDAAGFFVSWHALRTLVQLGVKPKRTIRVVGWTDEEQGGIGGDAYYEAHKQEAMNHVLAIESDTGLFEPWGLDFNGDSQSLLSMQQSGKLLQALGAGNVTFNADAGGTDIDPLCSSGVPCATFLTKDPINHKPPTESFDGYFYYHHSAADVITNLNSGDLQANSAAMAAWAYMASEMDTRLTKASSAALAKGKSGLRRKVREGL